MARITITPAEEDEVIVAGATSGGELEGQSFPEKPVEPEPEPESAGDFAERETPETLGSDATPVSPAVAESPAAGASRRTMSREKPNRADEYRETTLEDLDSTPMPLVQRIVIVAAVVCIIGALVYYFVVMR